VADRDAFLIRIDPETLAAVRRWADDELRSVNGQIEFLLRRALRDAGRLQPESKPGAVAGAKGVKAGDKPGGRTGGRTDGRR
jgi:hypothetical protein